MRTEWGALVLAVPFLWACRPWSLSVSAGGCMSADGCPDCGRTGEILAQPATRAAATGRVPDSHHEPSGDRANAAGETSEDAR